jgi:hypothetical protein
MVVCAQITIDKQPDRKYTYIVVDKINTCKNIKIGVFLLISIISGSFGD